MKKAIAALAFLELAAIPLATPAADAARYSDRLFDAHLHLN
jgi:hypothetical protein